MLSWLWGSPKKSTTKITARDKAILDLKRQRDRIKQYQKRIADVQLREHTLAKSCLASGDKKRALLFLRKEKFQRGLIHKTDEQLATLEDLVSSIEFAQIQADVAFGLEQGAKVLKELNSELSLERVDKIMDDTADGIAYQEELSASLSGLISSADEAEVEAELAEMEREQQAVERPLDLPDAPKTSLPTINSPAKAEIVEREEREAIPA